MTLSTRSAHFQRYGEVLQEFGIAVTKNLCLTIKEIVAIVLEPRNLGKVEKLVRTVNVCAL